MAKKTKFKHTLGTIVSLTLLALISTTLYSSRVNAYPADSMWVQPPEIILGPSTPVGYKFNVTI